jgi:hypothetical protein
MPPLPMPAYLDPTTIARPPANPSHCTAALLSLDVPLIQDSPLPDSDKKLLDELTCHICYDLFYKPVTTPCQYTFCSKCLQRSLYYGSTCPICRQEILGFYFQEHPPNQTIMNISEKSSTYLLLLLISSPQSLSSSLSRKGRCHRTGRSSRPSKHPDLCMPT